MDGDLEIIFKQSAFKHGVTEVNISSLSNSVDVFHIFEPEKK